MRDPNKTYRHIILMGPPGSGKGTQASILCEKVGLPTFSMGQLFRDEIASGSELGKELKGLVDNGIIVNADMWAQVVKKELVKEKYQHGYVFDGISRRVEQAKALDKIFASRDFKKKNMAVDLVLLLQVPDEYLIERTIGRFQCAKCGAMYHDKFKPTKVFGVCDVCGSKEFTRRKDDNYEAMMTRLREFRRVTAPVIPYYEEKGLLVCIDGTGPIDVVSEKIRKVVGY